MNDWFTSMPGRIVTYDPTKQTATVKMCAERIFESAKVSEGLTITNDLVEVPVHTPSGGGWAITTPIKTGDTCILFFSKVGYDHWLFEDKDEGGTKFGRPVPHLRRSFSQEDGYALVGLNTIPRAIQSYTMDGSQWRNVDAVQNIHLREDLSIEINSPIKVTINAPSVEVNCSTAVVNATSSNTITSPTSTFNGNMVVTGSLDVTGAVIGGAAGSFAAAVSGLTGSFGGISVENHTHTENNVDNGQTSSAN